MAYVTQTFVDRVKDANGNIVTEGTKIKKQHMDHIEAGIVANEKAISTNASNIAKKQDALVSGTNIKTVNGQSLLGSGDIPIEGGNSANGMNGKVISILGDSISTYRGYIPVADGFNEEHPSAYPGQDVTKVEYTWWMQVINALGAKLGINDSWSGSRVHNTYEADNPGGNVGAKVCMASMTRITNLGSNGTPDVILFYGGTNDGKFSTVGTFDSTQVYNSVDLEAKTWSSFADAYKTAIMRIQYLYPNARLICITPMFVRNWYDHAVLDKFADVIVEICNYFGVPCIDLRRCGLSYANLNTFLGDGLHPNKAGMTMVANYILAQLKSECMLVEGENVVYSVTNELSTLTTSMPQVKGVSKGATYTAKLSGTTDFTGVTVYMGTSNITNTALSADGTITISNVSGAIVIADTDIEPPVVQTYSVTFEENGGSAVADLTNQTELPNPLPATTRDGYTFDGWYTNSDLTAPAMAGAALTANATLYAKWTEIVVNPDGGDEGGSEGGGSEGGEDLGVDVPTETTWYVDFTGETGSYNYPNSGGAVAFSQADTYNKCVGVAVNAVKLKVSGDGAIGYGRVAADGDTYEHLGAIELTGAVTNGADATAQVFKLEKAIVLADGERLAIMEYGGNYPGKIWVSTTSSNNAAMVRTNIRSAGASKDETWKLPIGIGYVVD